MSSKPSALTYTKAESGESKYGDAIELIIRCQDGKTELFIDWRQFLGLSDDGQSVTTRLGKAAAVRRIWNLSTDQQATFYTGSSIALIKSMFGQTRFVAQTTPYGDSPRTATFDIAGVDVAVKNVRKACHW